MSTTAAPHMATANATHTAILSDGMMVSKRLMASSYAYHARYTTPRLLGKAFDEKPQLESSSYLNTIKEIVSILHTMS